jgi:hypothetical protein
MEPAVGRNDRTVELGTVPELSENLLHKWTTPGDEKKLQVFCSIIPANFGQLRGTTPGKNVRVPELSENIIKKTDNSEGQLRVKKMLESRSCPKI